MKILVSIIMPCRNERDYIGKAMDSLLSQEGIDGDFEILVADGMSEDGTSEILRTYKEMHLQVKIIRNTRKGIPFALELLLGLARGEYILRADAHCVYPPNYVVTLLSYLKDHRSDNVGGVIQTLPSVDTPKAKVIASCLNSKFGVSVSFRTLAGNTPVDVETVPFGAWRADHFRKFGPFDARFLRAQDLEHNIRVKKMGGRVLCLPWLKISYYARETFEKFRKMAFQYGYWKIPVKTKHKMIFSIRQYFPPLLILGTVFSIPLALIFSNLSLLFPITYLFANFFASLHTALKDKNISRFYLYMYAYALFHFSYGLGYLRGYWDVYIMKKFGFTEITR